MTPEYILGMQSQIYALNYDLNNVKAERDAVILQNDKLEARLEMLLSELDDIVSTLGCGKDNIVDSVQEVKFQRDALGKQLLISQSAIATQEDFNNALKAERDALLAKLALAEADILQREAKLLLTAHEAHGCQLSERAKATLKSIGGIMLTRAALARAKAQGGAE